MDENRPRPVERVEELKVGVMWNCDDAQALYAQGVVLHDLGRDDEAIPMLERAIMLEPDTPKFRFSLAKSYEAVGDFHGAANNFLSAYQIDRAYTDAINGYMRVIPKFLALQSKKSEVGQA